MSLWKILTAHLVVVCLAGCTSTAKMTALDRSLVNKTITRTATGGASITMDGNFILNPTAAVETFHTVAAKELGGRPYRYSYAVDKKQFTRQIPAPSSSGSAPGGGSSGAASGSSGTYYPIFVPTGQGGGVGGGEAAIILGSIALIILIAKLAADSKKKKAAMTVTGEKPAASQPAPAPAQPREEVVTTNILRITGIAEPVPQVALDRTKTVAVQIPDQPPVIGKLKPEVARAIAEEIRGGFESLGCQTRLGGGAAKAGYVVETSVLRSQGSVITYSSLTLEITLREIAGGKELARWIVQAGEKPFDLKSQNERMYGIGIATGILAKPLREQLNRYLR